MAFALHPRLAADTIPIGELGLCAVRLMNDARFPWLVLVPRRDAVSELFDLTAAERTQLMEETTAAGRALARSSGAAKINIGALGNLVSQLHVHVVSRQQGDVAWPRPVWGFGDPVPYEAEAAESLIATLSAHLALA